MQKSATSARGMEPASPSMTLTTPVGASTVRPPGRTMHHSRSLPGPDVKRASWLFLSVKMDDMTVFMRILKKKGAWSFESPAPMDVTTATRLTSYFFMASMMMAEPSVSMVGPTSLVLPPSAMMTPSMSPDSKTFSTSAATSSMSSAFSAGKGRFMSRSSTTFVSPTETTKAPLRGFSSLIFTSALPSKAFKTLFARVLNAPQLLQASTTTTPPSDGGASAFVFAAFFGSLSFFAEALRFGAMATDAG
mmetsp:Transcript_5444/g.17272  ORF Transcript_5444/g.17272 Transcript_5444/m.17272 type:complete len:248 (-) Transcript_5444:21-764(-)